MKKLLIIVFTVLLIGCNFDTIDAPYGKDFNETRKKVGLRIIDNSFKSKKIVLDDFKKSPIRRKIKELPIFLSEIEKPTYVGKTIFLNENNGDIIFEEDIFVSGVNKVGVDNSVVESLVLRFTFESIEYFFERPSRLGGNINQSYKKGWEYIYSFPILLGPSSNKPAIIYYESKEKIISEKEADSILKSWNLKRLNY